MTLGKHFTPGGPLATRTPLREAMARATRLPEPEALAPLVALAQLDVSLAQRTDALARQLVHGLRQGPVQGGRAGRVQSLMQAYALSSEEGVALMCLAEALLRIPDAATRDALIRDKIGQGDWHQHLGRSDSLFVNAASWGLLLTGKLVATHREGALMDSLTRLVGKSGEPLIRKGVDMAMRMLGEQFVTGETIGQALERARDMEAKGFRYSYDMLGEAALTADDAQRYLVAYEQAIHAIGRSAQGDSAVERAGISIKLSALHPRYSRAQHQRVQDELLPRVLHLATLARQYNIGLNIDAEEADRLDISLDLLEALCNAPALQGWHGMGFVIQAYQKRCPFVIDWVVDLARRTGHRLMIRLVKGAYWDSEVKRAQLDGQADYPVYTRKHHTDVSYLACARKLLAAPDAVYPQFATHNAHTVAALVHLAEAELGAWAPGQYEFQCLHGMGEPLYHQVVGTGQLDRPCRIYAPVGTHETLLAYLVRRLLENGANSSFVNRMADETVSVDDLVQYPVQRLHAEAAQTERGLGHPHPHIPLPGALYGAARANSTGPDLAHEPTLRQLATHMAQHAADQGGVLNVGPMLADGGWMAQVAVPVTAPGFVAGVLAGAWADNAVDTVEGNVAAAATPSNPTQTATPADTQPATTLPIINPADHADVLGTVRHATPAEVGAALQAAADFAPTWGLVPPVQRAALLEQAAHLLQADTPRAMALLVREAGKTWAHAVAEVREAVDFLRYYAAQVRRDFDPATHRPLGAVVCISPWNFPLAIFLGQVSAALAAGNTVLAKPAEATPAIAALAVRLLWQAGVPPAAVQLLPGYGKDVGQQLVADPRTQGVLFTGSTETARALQATLAQRLNAHGQAVPLVAETGGQNCMVVDSSALLEQVATDAVASAFEAAGQRCSALRVLCVQDDVADRLLHMLQGAMAEIRMGTPAQLHTDMGPVIDARAQTTIEAHVQRMADTGHRVHRVAHTASIPSCMAASQPDSTSKADASSGPQGTYLLPTLIELNSLNELGREVFGPVLHVVRYRRADLPALLAQINATGYALTLGVHSRIDETIAQVLDHTHAGNVYINRNMVGAVVGVQPFGGEGLSGTGPKAGGPLYLLRLLAHNPDDAALRSVQASGAVGLPQATPALQALHNWAAAQGGAHAPHLALAHQCARLAACNPAGLQATLLGPTGERNVYQVHARKQVLCTVGQHPSAAEDLLSQLAAVLAVGGHAVWDAHHPAATRLHAQLPAVVQARIQLAADWAQAEADAALCHGHATDHLHTAQVLAQRTGPIVTLTTLPPGAAVPLARLVAERSISTNTAAAGGNASLMTLGA